MKKFLAGILLLAGPLFAQLSTVEQTQALQKVLWKDQVLAGLHDTYVDVNVLPAVEMTDSDGKQCGCWGMAFHNETGYHIRIMAAKDFPKDYPKRDIAHQQRRIVAHELLHIVFSERGMPDDVQDRFIEAVLPLMEVK